MEEDIKIVTDAHLLYCPYSDSRIKALVRKPRIFTLNDSQYSSVADNYLELEKNVIWSEYAAQLAPSIKPLILFSFAAPDFHTLGTQDKITCLKFGFFEIWLVHVSRLINTAHGTITFCNGYCMSKKQLETIYNIEFVDMLLDFCGCLNDLQISDTVIALYSMIILHNPDIHGVDNPTEIQLIQTKYLKRLKYHLVVKSQQRETFEILVSLLPELNALGTKHLQFVEQIWENHSQISKPLLLTEVFDFAADEEDIMQIIQKIHIE